MPFNHESTIFITGATSGFGQACARRFARDTPAKLVLLGRRADRLNTLARELDCECHVIVADMRQRPALEKAVANLPEAFREVEVLVNNAGLALGLGGADQAHLDDWETMIDTNCKGLVTLTRLLLPGMLARRRGHIVNIGSTAGNYSYPGGNVYGATKAFVKQFSLNLIADIAGRPVRVTNLEPGMAETEFSKVRFHGDEAAADKVYQGWQPMSADDIAEAVFWVTTLPHHVNVNRLEMMPVQQSFAGFTVRKDS